jgi:lipopolysaccharide export system protein LptA
MFEFFFIYFFLFVSDGFCNNKPIRLEADKIRIQKNKNIMIFTGNVKAEQEELNILADKMVVNYHTNKDGKINIDNIEVKDNVVLKNKTITAQSNNGFYDFKKRIITLRDEIVLNEKDAVIFGNVLIYNVKTGATNIEGKNENKKSNDRVIIILDNINDIKDKYDKKK